MGNVPLKSKWRPAKKMALKEPQLPENFREIKDIQLFFEFPSYLNIVDTGLWRCGSAAALPVSSPDAPVADIFRPPA